MNTVALSEVIAPSGSRAGGDSEYPVFSVTKHSGFVRSDDYFKKQVYSRDLKGYKRVQPGDFAYATIHLDEGSVGIAPQDGLISPMYTVFAADASRVLPEYLIRFLKSPIALKQYDRLGKGSVHRRRSISLEVLGAMPVPLPPLDEQCRIATILDRADAMRAKRRQMLAHLDSLVGAVFNALFRDELPRRPIGAVAKVTTGQTPPTALEGMFEGPIPFVTPGDLGSGKPVLRSLTNEGARASRLVRPGATFVCCIGATIGKVGVASVGSAFNQQINAIEWDPAIVDDAYGHEAMKLLKPEIVAQGASTTLPLLPKGRFVKIEIPVPNLEDQRRFSAHVSRIDETRKRIEKVLEGDDRLFASVQARAFRGEL